MDSYNPSHHLLKHFQKTQDNLYGFMNTCSLWVSSPFGAVAGSHARGDASAPRGFPAHLRVLSRLHVSLPSLSLTVAFTGLLGHKRLQNQNWREEAKKPASFSTINYHDRECRQTAHSFFCIVHHITSARKRYGNLPPTTWHVSVNCDFYCLCSVFLPWPNFALSKTAERFFSKWRSLTLLLCLSLKTK